MTDAPGVRVQDATEVDPGALDALMASTYSPAKCALLRKHGDWCHRGNQNRFIVLRGEELAGYSAVIPQPLHLPDRVVPATWLIDVYVHERFRGQKLQRHLDDRVRATAPVQLGVPNALAMKVHRKHGWGVRDDYKVLLLPLEPLALPSIRRVGGWRGVVARAGAAAATPLTWLYKQATRARTPRDAWRLHDPDPHALAAVFQRHAAAWVTTHRDAGFLKWRYLDTPDRAQLAFFAAGPSRERPSVVAIVRILPRGDGIVGRLLDVFGDLDDRPRLASVLTLVAQHAIAEGAAQVTAVATNPQVTSALRSRGFIPFGPYRFCWISDDAATMRAIERGPCHWCLGDSDSDRDS